MTNLPSKTKIFKIIVAGSGGVGKTSLLHRFQTGEFTSAAATIGLSFSTKAIKHKNGESSILSLWDFSGEDRFQTLFPEFCKDSRACLAIFDLTRLESLEHML